MLIDTHCHLCDDAFATDLNAVVKNAIDAGVGKIVLACCDESEAMPIKALCLQYPNHLYPTLGIHPENIAVDYKAQFEALKQHELTDIVAIGEIGIDLHYDTTRLADQQDLLLMQMQWAMEHNLPVLLHIRDAMPEFIELLRTHFGEGKQRPSGVLHCYSGTAEQALEVQKYGDWMFGIGGTLTYKKSLVPEVAQAIGIDRIVLETDAPYLAPVPHRGHRNEPAYTADTAQYLAELLGLSPEEVAEKTTTNAQNLLHLG